MVRMVSPETGNYGILFLRKQCRRDQFDGFPMMICMVYQGLGYSWNVLILKQLTKERVRKGMEEGCFFYVHAPDGHEGSKPPSIEAIKINQDKEIITLETHGQDSIRWISRGKVIHKGNTYPVSDYPDNEKYIRAEIYGSGGTIVGTQPFGIKKP